MGQGNFEDKSVNLGVEFVLREKSNGGQGYFEVRQVLYSVDLLGCAPVLLFSQWFPASADREILMEVEIKASVGLLISGTFQICIAIYTL